MAYEYSSILDQADALAADASLSLSVVLAQIATVDAHARQSADEAFADRSPDERRVVFNEIADRIYRAGIAARALDRGSVTQPAPVPSSGPAAPPGGASSGPTVTIPDQSATPDRPDHVPNTATEAHALGWERPSWAQSIMVAPGTPYGDDVVTTGSGPLFLVQYVSPDGYTVSVADDYRPVDLKTGVATAEDALDQGLEMDRVRVTVIGTVAGNFPAIDSELPFSDPKNVPSEFGTFTGNPPQTAEEAIVYGWTLVQVKYGSDGLVYGLPAESPKWLPFDDPGDVPPELQHFLDGGGGSDVGDGDGGDDGGDDGDKTKGQAVAGSGINWPAVAAGAGGGFFVAGPVGSVVGGVAAAVLSKKKAAAAAASGGAGSEGSGEQSGPGGHPRDDTGDAPDDSGNDIDADVEPTDLESALALGWALSDLNGPNGETVVISPDGTRRLMFGGGRRFPKDEVVDAA